MAGREIPPTLLLSPPMVGGEYSALTVLDTVDRMLVWLKDSTTSQDGCETSTQPSVKATKSPTKPPRRSSPSTTSSDPPMRLALVWETTWSQSLTMVTTVRDLLTAVTSFSLAHPGRSPLGAASGWVLRFEVTFETRHGRPFVVAVLWPDLAEVGPDGTWT